MSGGMDLKNEVLNTGVCALCGACLDWCPYIKNIEDHLVLSFDCNVPQGRCYSLCPRTFTDWAAVNERYLADTPRSVEIGAYFKVYKVQAKKSIEGQQNGGTVTHLLKILLEEGLVERVLLTSSDDAISPTALLTKDVAELEKSTGSRFLAAPSFRKLITAQEEGVESLGVVGRPCQIQAVRKWDFNKRPERPAIDLICIGLFCMWSLNWDFKDFLAARFPNDEVVKIVMLEDGIELVTKSGSSHISAEEIRPYTRPAGCNYCLDMTAELADISVGAFEIDPGWNTVVIRSSKGQDLFDKAISRGYLVVEDYPEGELNRLKNASMGKKIRNFKNILAAEARGIKPFIDLDSAEYTQIRNLAEGAVK